MKPEERLVLDLSEFVATVDGKLDLSSMVQALITQANVIKEYERVMEELLFLVSGHPDRPMLRTNIQMFDHIYRKLKVLLENENKPNPSGSPAKG